MLKPKQVGSYPDRDVDCQERKKPTPQPQLPIPAGWAY